MVMMFVIRIKQLRNLIQVPQHLTHILIHARLYMAKLNKYVICHVHCTQADRSCSEYKADQSSLVA